MTKPPRENSILLSRGLLIAGNTIQTLGLLFMYSHVFIVALIDFSVYSLEMGAAVVHAVYWGMLDYLILSILIFGKGLMFLDFIN
jgi:hypothetical protein